MNGCTEIKHAEESISEVDSEDRDKKAKWAEVMKLAEQYGFIRFAYGGFAMLSIDKEAMKTK